jgi:hypothetical protein
VDTIIFKGFQVEIRFTKTGLVVLSLTRGIFGLKTLQALKTAGCP